LPSTAEESKDAQTLLGATKCSLPLALIPAIS
jgi:hypothetical protein